MNSKQITASAANFWRKIMHMQNEMVDDVL